jgi:hypothetical protein
MTMWSPGRPLVHPATWVAPGVEMAVCGDTATPEVGLGEGQSCPVRDTHQDDCGGYRATPEDRGLERPFPATKKRRWCELLDAIEGPVDVLNARLRGVFGRVLLDHRDRRVHFRRLDWSESGVSLMFGWPTAHVCGAVC